MSKAIHKKVIYTALFGCYDYINSLPKLPENVSAICFTDNPDLDASGWEVRQVKAHTKPNLMNRKIKILAHKFLPEFNESLYVDASLLIKTDPTPLFEKYLEHHWLALPAHPFRETVRREAWECVICNKITGNVACAQLNEYINDGFPIDQKGLTANGIIIRRHLEEECVRLMTAWWQEFQYYPFRDQLSLQYALWRTGTHALKIEESPWRSPEFFELMKHSHERGFIYSPLFIKLKKMWRILSLGVPYALRLHWKR